MPGYHGTYFYGDYCSALVRSFRLQNGVAVDQRDWTSALGRDVGAISSFGVDADGELYIVDHLGEVFRIVPAGGGSVRDDHAAEAVVRGVRLVVVVAEAEGREGGSFDPPALAGRYGP
jgi:hypothetical protein